MLWGAIVGFLVFAWAAPVLAQERCPATKTGALSAQSPKQLGRLQNGAASACGTSKTVPAVLQPTTAFAYQAYGFRNRSRDPQCITVTLTSTTGSGLQSTTYLGAYDPNNPQKNYLGDGGGNAATSTITYGVTVPSMADFAVVVSSVTANATASYSLAVAGCGSVVITGVVPNAGPTAGGTAVTIKGSGFLANPAFKVGGTPATNIALVDEGTITATTPAGAAGAADVVVTNTDTTTDTLPAGFLYVPPTATTVSLASSKNPTVFGEKVTFTVKLSSAAGTPTGSVSVYDGATKLGDATLAAGTATFDATTLGVGDHAITAQWAGNATYAAGTSAVVSQEVDKASTSTTIASSKNPSGVGDSVTFTATVVAVAPGAGKPTGNVDFSEAGVSIGSGALDATGKATFTTGALAVGNHNVIATYAGDASFLTSASSTLVQSVGLQATTTALVSSKNPSRPGEAVVFTATVKPTTGATNPTGAVTFKDGTSNIGVGQLDNAGNTTLSTSALAEGTHTITAVYNGDAVYGTSTSAALSQVVTKDTGSSTSSSGGSSTSSSSSGGASSGTSGSSSSSGDADAGDDKEGAAVVDNAGGCGCHTTEASGSALSGLALVVAAVAIATRRRRR